MVRHTGEGAADFFPLPHPLPSRPSDPPRPHRDPSAVERLAKKVATVCELRFPATEVTPVTTRGPGGVTYLRVSPVRGRGIDRLSRSVQFPIGVYTTAPRRREIQRFVDEVLALFQVEEAMLVYDGAPADAELVAWAKIQDIELVPFAEFQMGHDLDRFATHQATELQTDRVYRAEAYIPQRYTEVRSDPGADAPRLDLLATLRNWIDQPEGGLVLVLGRFGHGKTFLLRQLARELAHGSAVLPVLVDLRGFTGTQSLDQLIASTLAGRDPENTALPTFRYLQQAGRIVLLFDSFDELAARVTYERATDHLGTLMRAAEGRAKVIVTSRDHHFLSNAEVLRALDPEHRINHRVVQLAEFDDDQIRLCLAKLLRGPDSTETWLGLLHDIKDLLELSRNPRMLSFIASLRIEQLRSVVAEDGTVTAASLYQQIIAEWLRYEAGRLAALGPSAPAADELRIAAEQIALRVWRAPSKSLDLDDLREIAAGAFQNPDEWGGLTPLEPEEAAHLLGSATLLVRDGEQRFTFVHHSVHDWLVAHYLADHLAPEGNDTVALPTHPLTPQMVDFLCGLAGQAAVHDWADGITRRSSAPAGARRNAIGVLRQLRVAVTPRGLAGADLRGEVFSSESLPGVDLSRSNLGGARLVATDLTGARLVETILTSACLDRAVLTNADVTRATLARCRLRGADLRGAVLNRADLRRAELVGATGLDLAALRPSDVLGAALPGVRPRLQTRSSAMAHTLALHAGLRVVAGGCADGVVRLWDADTGVALRGLLGPTGSVYAVAFSGDGRYLAAAGEDRVIRLWDLADSQRSTVLGDHAGWIRALAFSPDGRVLASGGHDGSTRLWDVATGGVVHTLRGGEGGIRTLAYAPDGRTLASAGQDETIWLWNAGDGRLDRTLAEHTGTVYSIAYAPSGHQLASASDDRKIYLWDPITGEVSRVLTGHAGWIRALAYAPDGRHLASGGDDGTIRLWNPDSGELVTTVPGHPGGVTALCYDPVSGFLVSAGQDATVTVWDTNTGRQVRGLGSPERAGPQTVACSPVGDWLVTGAPDGTVRVWDLSDAGRVRTLRAGSGAVNAVTLVAEPARLMSAAEDDGVRLWDPATGEPAGMLTGTAGPVRCLARSPDGARVAAAGDERTVWVWRTSAPDSPQALSGHVDTVSAIAFAPDGARLASGGHDHTVRLWDLAGGNTTEDVLTGHTSAVRAVAYSPKGELLASAGKGGMIRVWDPGTGVMRAAWEGHPAAINALAFPADGQILASAGDDAVIRLWDLSGHLVGEPLAGHLGPVHAMTVTAGGRYLVSTGADRTVRLWDLASHTLHATLVSLDGGGSAVFFEDLRYAAHGAIRDECWYAIGLCRWQVGELDDFVPGLRRVSAGTRLW